MTMETDEATERNNAPITPNWYPDISPIWSSLIFKKKIKLNIKKKKKKYKIIRQPLHWLNQKFTLKKKCSY